MKLLLGSLFILFINSVLADCSGHGFTFWPKNGELRQGQVIIIQGYGQTQKLITSIGVTNTFYLQSGTKKVKLNVKLLYSSKVSETQAILLPEDSLEVGALYCLICEQDIKNDKYDDYERFVKTQSPAWNIVQAKNEKTIWSKEPTKQSFCYTEFGCGPSIYATFNLGVADSSFLLIRATLTDAATGKQSSYIIPVETNKIDIGRSMCAGEFALEHGKEYAVKFESLDWYNLSVLHTTKSIPFKASE